MNLPADAWLHRRLHDAFVGGVSRLREAVRSVTPADRAERIPALVSWSTGLVAEIGAHHLDEEVTVFAALREQVAAAKPLMEPLLADHARLAALLPEVEDALGDLADPERPFHASQTSVERVLDDLETLLRAHVEEEAADVLALVERHLTYAEHPRAASWPA